MCKKKDYVTENLNVQSALKIQCHSTIHSENLSQRKMKNFI